MTGLKAKVIDIILPIKLASEHAGMFGEVIYFFVLN